MNKTLISILMFGFLLLFIISPFAGLASLMILLLFTAFFSLVSNIFQAIIGSSDTNSNSSG
ncbi:hypothetical protein SD80_022745 [Scytonema tolypothrichoides VB-61278]|nr:hypothetical protein SD80_022745 [Scytonema tolypothrichoides VB-61278]